MEKCHSWFDALNCVYIYYVNCHWNCIKVLRSVHFVHWCKNRISKMNLQITIKKPVMKAANKKQNKKTFMSGIPPLAFIEASLSDPHELLWTCA